MAHRLVEGAVAVVDRDSVLLEEVLLDEARDVERDLVGLAERALADELHDLGELVLLLEDLLRRVAVVQEVGLGALVVRLQDARAGWGGGGVRGRRDRTGLERGSLFRVRDVPVDGWEVLALGELPRVGEGKSADIARESRNGGALVQTPEDLDNTEGGRGDRVGEV